MDEQEEEEEEKMWKRRRRRMKGGGEEEKEDKEEEEEEDFFKFFEAVSWKRGYFSHPKGLGFSFPVNLNYPKCLENSNMISFVLTSWVTSC